ncbi:MAG TPA: radical SAM protein [Sphaerochaeta sp.]|nr:SPASM domain-containing protein [Spirochaetales bacterium]HKM08549.1 radical SAM protein [Sphaerochaeta sp.]
MKRHHITLMIKPSSAACNLDCDYCFYHETADNREVGCRPFMKDDVMVATITKALAEAKGCTFAFQGGEPSLIGLPFYEKFVETVNRLNKDGDAINYAFQTNGVLIDEAWAKFFKKNNFLVGVSFDGFPRLHDMHRLDPQGKKSARKVLAGIAQLREHGAEFNILSVVTNELAENVDMMWDYMTRNNHRYLQFIPCMESLEGLGEKPFLSAENYARFLKRLFDLWFNAWQSGKPISVRFFDNLVGMLAGYPPESCDMAGICSVQYVVESDGSIYPCDFFCDDDSYLGNVLADEFATLDAKRLEMRFIEDSPNSIDACASCQWKELCRGGCKRYRGEEGYRFCSTMLDFYPYVIRRFEHVARTLIR